MTALGGQSVVNAVDEEEYEAGDYGYRYLVRIFEGIGGLVRRNPSICSLLCFLEGALTFICFRRQTIDGFQGADVILFFCLCLGWTYSTLYVLQSFFMLYVLGNVWSIHVRCDLVGMRGGWNKTTYNKFVHDTS